MLCAAFFFSYLIISSSLSAQVPVPVFLPTTLDSGEKILAAVEELRGKVPSNPLETELLNLSGMVPEQDGKTEASDVASEFPAEFLTLWSAGVYVWGCVNQEKVWGFFYFRERFFEYNSAVIEFLY